jgi:hypothetical protein
MKWQFYFLLLIITVTFFSACSSGAHFQRSTELDSDGLDISAQGAIGGLQTADSPRFEGDGGRDIRLAILAPETQGDVPSYLPLYIQGLLNNNFGKYSDITLIDRQNLDRIISEQNIAANGYYSDTDFSTIGNLTNTRYFLFGTIQKLSGVHYSLQLSITDSEAGIRRANYMGNGTLAQLEGTGTLINTASADLLDQIGVRLTNTGRQALLAGNTSTVQAAAGLARGISAQSAGQEVEALLNFSQSVAFDPSQMEALSRLTSLSSTISGGSISERIVNDILARNQWIETFRETSRFFNDHLPFEIIFDPNLIQIGQTDYTRGLANLGMRISLNPSAAGFDVLNALLEGLERTGRRSIWGFDGWPLQDTNPKIARTVVFTENRSFDYKIDIALVNEHNKTLGRNSVTLNTGKITFSPGNSRVSPPAGAFETVHFNNVKALDLTPTLTIVIVAINGIPTRRLPSGYMRIDTGDLEEKARIVADQKARVEWEESDRRARKTAQAEQEKRDAADRRAWEARQAEWEKEQAKQEAEREKREKAAKRARESQERLARFKETSQRVGYIALGIVGIVVLLGVIYLFRPPDNSSEAHNY